MEKKDKDIVDLAWKNFYETGEIGAYLLYKKLSEEKTKNATNDNTRSGPTRDRL